MTIFDLALILILFIFVATGYRLGFIHTLGALLGTVAGVLLASHYYPQVSAKLIKFFLGDPTTAKIVSFLVIFVVTNRLVGLVFWIIDKIFKLLHFIPFLGLINHIGGAVLGLAEGVIVLGVTLYFSGKIAGFVPWFADAMKQSELARELVNYSKLLIPLLPEAVRQIKSNIPFLK